MKLTPFDGLSLAARLSAGFAFLLLVLVATGAWNALELRSLGAGMSQIVEVDNRRIELARDLSDGINTMASQVRTATMLAEMDQAGAAAEVKALAATMAAYDEASRALTAVLADDPAATDDRRLLAEIDALAKKAMAELQAAAAQASDGDSVGAAMALTKRVRPTELAWRQKVNDVVKLQTARSAAAVAQAQASRVRHMSLGAGVLALALVAGATLAWRLVISIQRPIRHACSVTERIAQGDLTSAVQLQGSDDLGRLLQAVAAMQLRLRSLVGEIRTTSESIQVASGEVASGNLDLSQRTELAASNLQQTASSVHGMASHVRHNVDSAAQAQALVGTASQVASRGGKVMNEVVQTMQGIHTCSLAHAAERAPASSPNLPLER